MRDFLPAGLRGMLVAAFFAAYMSTIATQLNWGTSYLVNDFDWWRAERAQVEAGTFVPEVREMYAQSMGFDKFRREFTAFWQLPPDFEIEEA